MSPLHFRFAENEIKALLDTMVMIVDTREQKNRHILEYFDKKKVPYMHRGLKTGDYTAMLPKNDELGIPRDLFLPGLIERKNSVNELVESIKDRTRFENELIRGARQPFTMIVEDADGYEKILKGDYISKYTPQALLGSLKTFEARYGFTTVFLSPQFSGNYIYHHFYYMAREAMKGA
ncbi:ERCC4 domain-containing protein [Brevibacillus sp. DP1.3A]|uniref:ERCC4 domain-containing protein n=1 Tax=Brevibacillus sp. DP1.3A TaxID=2738867 RepID=UPI00156B1025|nr:ERCC4 domain-containing protein [Brevibacillus sp. DP1.3A]UED76082.1 ERCC4 domain-containing protein [Brevibacillus sp. DP1.3A]